MRVVIVHDSQYGNGKAVAEAFQSDDPPSSRRAET